MLQCVGVAESTTVAERVLKRLCNTGKEDN